MKVMSALLSRGFLCIQEVTGLNIESIAVFLRYFVVFFNVSRQMLGQIDKGMTYGHSA
jgi:hypothetical protein